eukprot:NODE_489_length_6860_cov_1.209289.p3 type:complete len:303 gc:universal NODE_489_length_6860_cov_1.209289:220-1128(+)
MGEIKNLTLSDCRLLQYTESGVLTSKKVIVLFHGLFSVGDAHAQHEFYKKLNVHCIAQNLPGWVQSSPWPKNKPVKEFAHDVDQMLKHVLKDVTNHDIYVMGGSYGSVFAQIAAGNLEYVKHMMIVGGFSSFYRNKDYAKGMSWLNWISVGPPGYYFTFIGKMIAAGIKSKIKTEEGARSIMEKAMHLSDEDKSLSKEWTIRTGKTLEGLIDKMSKDMMLSMKYTNVGYHQVPIFINEDWGFDPEEISSKHIKIICARNDKQAHMSMHEWNAKHYETDLEIIEGGHLAAVFTIDQMIADFLK